MSMLTRLRPSPALIVAMAALVMAMSGAAIALPGKGTVQTNDLKNGAVTKKKIARGAVGSAQIIGKSIKGNRLKDGAVTKKQLRDGAVTEKKLENQAVTAAKVKDGTLTGKQVAAEGLSSANLSDYAVIGSADGKAVRVTATEAATLAAAKAAAPQTTLLTDGPITVYAKCYRDSAVGDIHGDIFVKTSTNGVIVQGTDQLPAGNATLLDTTTTEDDSELQTLNVTVANAGTVAEAEHVIIGPDGPSLNLLTSIAVKQGAFGGGNGAFGDGNVCLFGGSAFG